MNALARREHSELELRRKLNTTFEFSDEIDSVIQALQTEGLQSDTRFAQAYTRKRINLGMGPVKIQAELNHRGINPGIIADCFIELDTDWQEHASNMRARRFGAEQPGDIKERARQGRFLQCRGFSSEQIHAALKM